MEESEDGIQRVETQQGVIHLHNDGRAELVSFKPDNTAENSSKKPIFHRPHLHLPFHPFQRKRYVLPEAKAASSSTETPRLDIAILITGSRGDVQPFIALAHVLQKEPYCHRVRIGTHPVFRSFVRENGIDFYPIGGDPEKLMSYMVRNPGVFPSMASIRAGDIGARKAELEEMLIGAWRACTERYDPDGPSDADDYHPPFVADAIISNPPTYASLHIAERLGIPLHYMFTMPWTPTHAFPHPLAQLDSSRTDAERINYLSYTQMEFLTWLGLSDIINRFRRRTLQLDPINPTWGTYLMSHLSVPFTYAWSPALIPKPADWDENISISGFFFLQKSSTFTPDPALKAFLDAGPPPIYVGFGSIVVDNPEAFVKLIMQAIEKAGVRALVSKGWSKINPNDIPENVLLLDNVPHDWLFQHVSAVVHHGGAGTCAIGLKLGCPTVIVPFFGDQFWWAGIVARAGAGPQAVPYKQLTADKLAANITAALQPDIKLKARELADKMKDEDGATTAARQFHELQHFPDIACMLCPKLPAVYRVKRTNIQLSAFAASVLIYKNKLIPSQFKLVRNRRWYVEEGPPGPLTGAIGSITGTLGAVYSDIRDYERSLALAALGGPILEKSDEGNGCMVVEVQPQSKMKATGRLMRNLTVDAVRGPASFFYNVANGCHNAPAAIFNDPTVRIRDEIVDMRSGLKVAGKETAFALSDSLTNLVVLPYHGAKHGSERPGGPVWNGAKGFGKAIGTIPFRMGSAVFAFPGYTIKGAEQQIRHQREKKVPLDLDAYIKQRKAKFPEAPPLGSINVDVERIRAHWVSRDPIVLRRIWQGLNALYESDPEEIEEAVRKYDSLRLVN